MRPEEDVIHTFQNRRRRANWVGWPMMLLGLVVCTWTLRWEARTPHLIGFALATIGVLTITYNMRCPACSKPPLIRSRRGVRMQFDPDECTNPQCGARLR